MIVDGYKAFVNKSDVASVVKEYVAIIAVGIIRPSTCLPIAGYASVTVRQSRTLSTVQRRDGARWKLVAGIALLHRIVSSELKSL